MYIVHESKGGLTQRTCSKMFKLGVDVQTGGFRVFLSPALNESPIWSTIAVQQQTGSILTSAANGI